MYSITMLIPKYIMYIMYTCIMKTTPSVLRIHNFLVMSTIIVDLSTIKLDTLDINFSKYTNQTIGLTRS